MSQFSITCCSTSDMSLSFYKENDVAYAKFHFTIDGREFPDDLGQSMPFDVFYRKVSEGSQATTSQVSQQDYMDMWKPLLDAGRDILHITLSSGISGTINSAVNARDNLIEHFPLGKIIIIDSLGASSGYGMLVTEACRLRDEGKSLEEAEKWLEENKLDLHHWFFSTDLTSYLRGGRISKTQARFGTLLKICPLMNMNLAGELVPREKIRTKRKVIQEIVSRMEKYARDGLAYNGLCYISHSDCLEDARTVAELVETRFKNLNGKVQINSVGTVIGSHTGPGTVALFFFGDRRPL